MKICQEAMNKQLMSTAVAPALRALLEGFIDYAGVFPPAKLPVDTAIANFGVYRESDHAWMLRWFVISAAEMAAVPAELDGSLSVLGAADDERAATIESVGVVKARRPVYCEVSPSNLEQLDIVRQNGCFAKIRTGGIKPEAIPSSADVSSFILACAERGLPFKATAGLHHPVRAEYALTYETDAPRAVMHGFLNVLMASAFAWHGKREIESVVAETDPTAFWFDDSGHWRNESLSVEELREARSKFVHSVGSCSFEEPVQELHLLGLI
jgi:hypothetical protein